MTEKPIVEYRVVFDKPPIQQEKGFNERINDLLANGWELHGSTTFLLSSIKQCQFGDEYEVTIAYQPMVRRSK